MSRGNTPYIHARACARVSRRAHKRRVAAKSGKRLRIRRDDRPKIDFNRVYGRAREIPRTRYNGITDGRNDDTSRIDTTVARDCYRDEKCVDNRRDARQVDGRTRVMHAALRGRAKTDWQRRKLRHRADTSAPHFAPVYARAAAAALMNGR